MIPYKLVLSKFKGWVLKKSDFKMIMSVLEICYTIMWMYLTLLNCTFHNGLLGKLYIMSKNIKMGSDVIAWQTNSFLWTSLKDLSPFLSKISKNILI